MRSTYLTSLARLGCIGTAGALALAGCTTKPDVAPEQPCGTYATVRLCPGLTAMCPTQHTTLELADGTLLQPSGPVWEAYQPHQQPGQTLYIGYTLAGARAAAHERGSVPARLSCLEATWRCGTPPFPGDN